MKGTPKLLRLRPIYEGWSRFLLADIRLEDGAEVERAVEDHGSAAAVLPYDVERRCALLVRLLRPGPLVAGAEEPFLLEAPAGMIEAEPADAAARREVLEETGARLGDLEAVGSPFSTPGVSTERIHLFLARYASTDHVAPGGGVEGEHENIRVVEMSLAELWRRADAGRIQDLKTLALVLMLRARRPALFEAP